MAGRKQRDPRKEAFWRKQVGAQQISGLSVRDFCREQGLAESGFHYWRREIDKRDREAAVVRKPRKAKKEPKTKKMSCLDAAAQLLADAGMSMTTGEMIDAMAKKGLWSSPNGRTPAATLYSAILRELKTKGKDPRFKKTERGKFAAKA